MRRSTRAGKARLPTIADLDQRTSAAQAARRLVTSLTSSLTSDMAGASSLSESERQLIQRAAMLGAVIESYEARWVAGQQIQVHEYLAAINVQRRVLATLFGPDLKRRMKDIDGFDSDGFDSNDPAIEVYRQAMQRHEREMEAE
jgi:hypothetical protein